LDDIPVWVRPGSLIVFGPEGTRRPDYDYTEGLTVKVYELEEGQTAEVSVPSGKGTEIAGTIRAERKQGELKISIEGKLSLASVELFIQGIEPKEATAGSLKSGKKGQYQFKERVGEVTIRL